VVAIKITQNLKDNFADCCFPDTNLFAPKEVVATEKVDFGRRDISFDWVPFNSRHPDTSFVRLLSMQIPPEIQRMQAPVYNFDSIDVDGKPEIAFKCLKRLVGERGFEPPTPWSRTRFQRLLNSIGLCRSQVLVIECVAAKL
jgi:hypothetical protein